jgi:DNA mismatch endonuclease (patch repair protein)
LPGRPDIVFPRRRIAIFVHGCFWHRHTNCRLARLPKSKLNYWVPKLERNAERDAKNQRALRKLGWRVLVVWECQLRTPSRLAARISTFLEKTTKGPSRGIAPARGEASLVCGTRSSRVFNRLTR